MGMNENESGSAYPPNPDVKSGSCLIAGFHALTDIRPSYWNAYKAESGATFSIDMVRLKLSFINGKGEWLSTHAQTFDCDNMSAWGGARFAQKRKRRLGELPSAFSRFSESRFWAHVKPTAAKCRLRDPLSRNAPARFAAIRPSRCGGLRSRKQLHRRDTSRACECRSSAL